MGKASTQLQNLIEWSSQLNFYGDQEITQAVALIRQELARDPRERDLRDIERKLKALATITRGTLMELGAPPRSARAVGIEDVVEVEAVRQARETLGTEDIPELGIVRQVRVIVQEVIPLG